MQVVTIAMSTCISINFEQTATIHMSCKPNNKGPALSMMRSCNSHGIKAHHGNEVYHVEASRYPIWVGLGLPARLDLPLTHITKRLHNLKNFTNGLLYKQALRWKWQHTPSQAGRERALHWHMFSALCTRCARGRLIPDELPLLPSCLTSRSSGW